MAVIDGVEIRGKDLKKIDIPWEERNVVHTFEDGWTIEVIRTPRDLELEGGILAHCGKQHAYWVHKGVEYLFSLRTPTGEPKATIHTKPAKYHGVPRPEDTGLRSWMDTKIDGLLCGLTSTYYEGVGRKPEGKTHFKFEDEILVVMGWGCRSMEYQTKAESWINSLRVEPDGTPAQGEVILEPEDDYFPDEDEYDEEDDDA